MVNVCICGGGSQGHISAGVIGSNPNYNVNVLTRRPEQWAHDFKSIDLEGKEYRAHIDIITDNAADIIPKCDIVLVCLPGYANVSFLETIKEYLSPTTYLGGVFGGSGFFLAVQKVLGHNVPCFALQRVPFTGRPLEYGHSARLKGYKPYLKVGMMNIPDSERILNFLKEVYQVPVYKLSHYMEATLSNSNPILHPVRLYVLFKDWTPTKIYTHIPFLYGEDWDDESSQLWVDCDKELRQIINALPINGEEIPSVLEYYECEDVQALTHKIRSIKPFIGVQPHMIEMEKGYKLDGDHRYFIEDIPYGLVLIKSVADLCHVTTPKIDMVLSWAQTVMGKEYLINGELRGKDVTESGACKDLKI